MECTYCGAALNVKLHPDCEEHDRARIEQYARTGHIVDHALRAVLAVGVEDVGGIDVADYVTTDSTWAAAHRDAREFIALEFGELMSEMQRVFAKLPLFPIGDSTAEPQFLKVEVEDVGAAMIAWLDRHPFPAEFETRT